MRTGKLGWLYLAHPDFTHRGEVEETLLSIVKHYFNGVEKELQVIPEIESITVNNKKLQQGVLALRGSYEELDSVRECLVHVFDEESEYNIGFLSRYSFISSSPIADCTWDHLYSILEKAATFS